MNCHYCNEQCFQDELPPYPTFECISCKVYYGRNYMEFYAKLNGDVYILTFRYFHTENACCLRVNTEPLIYFKKHLNNITPQNFKEFCLSNKIKTYILFS